MFTWAADAAGHQQAPSAFAVFDLSDPYRVWRLPQTGRTGLMTQTAASGTVARTDVSCATEVLQCPNDDGQVRWAGIQGPVQDRFKVQFSRFAAVRPVPDPRGPPG